MGEQERRKYERIDFKKELIVYVPDKFTKKQIEYYSKTINISQGGMLFYTIADFKENTQCIARFKSNKYSVVEKPGTVLRVVSQGRPDYLRDNEKMYALEFKETFPYDVLLEIAHKKAE